MPSCSAWRGRDGESPGGRLPPSTRAPFLVPCLSLIRTFRKRHSPLVREGCTLAAPDCNGLPTKNGIRVRTLLRWYLTDKRWAAGLADR